MNVIYVDDEIVAVEKFKYIAKNINELQKLMTFNKAAEALEYAEEYDVDIAFLDIEMAGMNGLELAKLLRQQNINTKIIFVTAYDNYALEAFSAEAVAYLLKPYNQEQVEATLHKVMGISYRRLENKSIYIKTMPNFDVYIDGKLLVFSRPKVKEMLAFLIDNDGRTVSLGEIIAALWEDRPSDGNTRSLCRVTWQRLCSMLDEAGIGFIVATENRQRYIKKEAYVSDYQKLMSGNEEAVKNYDGRYMAEYEWAEETNSILMQKTDYFGDGNVRK